MINKIIDKFMPWLLILLGLFVGYMGEVIPGGLGVILGILMFDFNLKKYIPYLVIILGLFLLGFMGQIYPAAACVILGVLFLLERFWPEEKKSE